MIDSVLTFAGALESQDSEYLKTWPLPAGRKAIANWHYDPLRGYDRQSLSWDNVEALVRAAQGIEGEEPASPPPPIVTCETAWLAFVAERKTRIGRVRLLGLVERRFVLTIANVRAIGAEIRGARYEIGPYDIETDKESFFEKTEVMGTDGPLASTLAVWAYITPAVLVEAYPSIAADLDALTAAVRPLLEWYRARLLGKTFRTSGPVPLFTTQDQCRTAVVNAYRALLRGNPRPTRALVAQRLGYSDSGLRDALTGWGLKWKDLVAEARAGK